MRILPTLCVTAVVTALAACTAELGAAPQDEARALQAAPGDARIAYVGRVVLGDGSPVAGAAVYVDDGAPYQVIKEWTEIPWRRLVPDPLAAADVGPGTVRGREPSGADGRFRVDGVRAPAGEGWVLAAAEGLVPGRKETKGLAAVRGVVDVGDVVVAAGRRVRAAVTRPGGGPSPDAWVVARPAEQVEGQGIWWSDETPGEIHVARTGADGTCVLSGLRAAKYEVGAFDDQSAPVAREIARDEETVALTLAGGATVRVEVVSRGSFSGHGRGEPLTGARVRIDPLNETGGWSMPGPPPLGDTRTDASGVAVFAGLDTHPAYEITVVPPDFAADRIHHPGAFSVRLVAKPGETVTASLDAPVGIGIAAFDAETKALVPGARCKASAVWDRYDRTGGSPVDLTGVTEESVVIFRNIRPGPWTFDVWAPDHLPTRVGPVDVHHTYQVTPSAEMAPAKATAAGRVVAKTTGLGIAGVTVATYEWVERVGDGQRASATTDETGAWRLSKLLGEGFPMTVEFRAAGWVPEFRSLAKDARAADLGTVEMLRAATIRGRVTGKDGRPLGRVQVIAHPWPFERPGLSKSEIAWTATTDEDGRYAIGELRPGAYGVEGQPRDAPIRLAEGGTSDCDVVR